MIWLWAKLKGYAALLGVILVGILVAYGKGRRGGLHSAQAEQRKQTDKLTTKFNKIDAQQPDFDAAIEHLRKRAGTDR